MISSKKVLAIIPARAGSKGLIGKNIREMNGKPLIHYSIETAIHSRYIDEVVISSDSDEILNSFQAASPKPIHRHLRPNELATDEATMDKVVLDALKQYPEFEVVVLLQATSPLRTVSDVDGALELSMNHGFAPVTTLSPVKPPTWMFKIEEDASLTPLLGAGSHRNRQTLPQYMALNGAVYVSSIADFKVHVSFLRENTRGYPMPISRSIDIDNEADFAMAEFLMTRFKS